MDTSIEVPSFKINRCFNKLNTTQILLTPQDLCKIFQIKKTTSEQWRLKGIGAKVVRLTGSRLIRYRREDVEDYIDALIPISSTSGGRKIQ